MMNKKHVVKQCVNVIKKMKNIKQFLFFLYSFFVIIKIIGERMIRVNKKTIIEIIIFISVLSICLLYLWKKATLAAYETEVGKELTLPIAGWNITVDGEDITTEDNKQISISDVTWNTSHTREGKVSPGSTGTMVILIDPQGTETAIKYELTVIDKTINPDTVLKVNSVAASNTTLTRTNNVYTGYITLNNINNGLKPRIVLQVQWENDENINDLDREIDSQEDYILINFKATQYKGS